MFEGTKRKYLSFPNKVLIYFYAQVNGFVVDINKHI